MQRPRRRALRALAAAAAGLLLPAGRLRAAPALLTRAIPASGEAVPAIGMGSWLTFHVGTDHLQRGIRRDVLQAFFDGGGTLIDSSPMYGSSEEVIGDLLPQVRGGDAVFAATKVWTLGRDSGIEQMEKSLSLWRLARFDLMQIHNLLDWQTHIETLKSWKAQGRARYIGITTSHGRRHDELEKALRAEPFDFVQFTYNIEDREAERRLLPLARERGIAVIANRPFQGGSLFRQVRGGPLPAWVADFDCHNWAQFFLKFIVSHPNVTCAIPATSNPAHMRENIGACRGRLPDAATRRRMIEHFRSL